MVEPLFSIDTEHTDMVHDAQLDFYGRRLVTGSSDTTVKVFDVRGGKYHLVQTLRGHSAPVWQVSWANPRFGDYIASSSADKTVIIWHRVEEGWIPVHRHTDPKAGAVNAVVWAPYEDDDLQLALGTSEGQVSILRLHEGQWHYSEVAPHDDPAYIGGVLGISWAPPSIAFKNPETENEYRMVVCGCDPEIRIYKGVRQEGGLETVWDVEEDLPVKHKEWVRDVAWAPQIGLANATIAACGQNDCVVVYSKETATSDWAAQVLDDIPPGTAVWRVSWSLAGNVLAVACGDTTGETRLFKQSLNGKWNCVKTIKDPAGPASKQEDVSDVPDRAQLSV